MLSVKDDLNDKKSQMHAALCMGFVCIFLGIPIWWKTTEVYRAELPYSHIQELALNPELSTKTSIVLVSSSDSQLQAIEDAFSKVEYASDLKYIKLEYVFSGSVMSTEKIQSMREEESGDSNQIMLFFVNSDEAVKPRVTLTHQRSIFIEMSDAFFSDEIPIVATSIMQLLTESVVNSLSLEDVMSRAYGVKRDFSREREEHMKKTIQPNKGYDIVFSLICPEPDKLQVSWDIEEAIDMYVKPMMDKLDGYADFQLGSQVLYYSGLSVKPKVTKLDDGSKQYHLTQQQLSHVVNPIESRLGTQVSPNPSLNFVVYIAEERYTPQYIQKADGSMSTTNTFLVPRWGAIMIQNFPKHEENVSSLPRFEKMDGKKMMSVFLAQLRQLLGVEEPGEFDNLEVSLGRTGNTGLRDWELDYLVRAKTVENIATSTHTLRTLAKLLEKIPNIVINDNIADEVYKAVNNIRRAKEHLSKGELRPALMYSNSAFVSSEIAFFDPTLLELLYFPEDQKFAIYIPLFLPIALPLIGSSLNALKWLKQTKGGKVKSE